MSLLTTSGINSFVNSFMSNEVKKSITPLANKRNFFQEQVSAYTAFSSKIESLKNELNKFVSEDGSSVFQSKKVTVGNDKFLSATADANANEGSYSLRIEQIAKSDTLISSSVSLDQVPGLSGDRSFYIKVKNGTGEDIRKEMTVSLTGNETNKEITNLIKDEINKEFGENLTASAFSPESNKYQLSLTSKNTGLDFIIADIGDLDGSGLLSNLGLNLGTERPVYNQQNNGFLYASTGTDNLLNAKISLNGINIFRNSNIISDLIDGVTLRLKMPMEGNEANLQLGIDTDIAAIKTGVQSFLDKFNDLYTFIRTKSKNEGNSRAVFNGDMNSSKILEFLNNEVYNNYNSETGDFKNLRAVGISFNTASGLSIADPSAFEKNLSANYENIHSFFNQMGNSLKDKLDPYLGAEGFLNKSKNSIQSNIKYTTDRINSVQKRIDKSAESLRKRYELLQAQLAALMTTQSFWGNSGNQEI